MHGVSLSQFEVITNSLFRLWSKYLGHYPPGSSYIRWEAQNTCATVRDHWHTMTRWEEFPSSSPVNNKQRMSPIGGPKSKSTLSQLRSGSTIRKKIFMLVPYYFMPSTLRPSHNAHRSCVLIHSSYQARGPDNNVSIQKSCLQESIFLSYLLLPM